MIHWRPLSKGSKNPPLNTQVLLKTVMGHWGIGIAFKANGYKAIGSIPAAKKGIFFNYHAITPTCSLMGEPKSTFTHWSLIS